MTTMTCPACTLPFGEVSDEYEFDIPPHTCGLPQVRHPLDHAAVSEPLARCSWCGEEYDLEDRQSVYYRVGHLPERDRYQEGRVP